MRICAHPTGRGSRGRGRGRGRGWRGCGDLREPASAVLREPAPARGSNEAVDFRVRPLRLRPGRGAEDSTERACRRTLLTALTVTNHVSAPSLTERSEAL